MSIEQSNKNIRRRGSTNIPPEILEKILLNLSVKSLFRFRVVSKSWRSMIVESGFAKRYRSGATLHHRERIFISSGMVTTRLCRTYFSGVWSCHPSSISSDSDVLIEDIATPIFCPIPGQEPSLLAYCDQELWFVEVEGSLYLWNPFVNLYRKTPSPVGGGTAVHRYYYALGYDSVNDDYKIIANRAPNEHQLYSLISDSWRMIAPPSPQTGSAKSAIVSVFASGTFYWLTKLHAGRIISFNSSDETFGEVAPPSIDQYGISTRQYVMKLIVLRGKLCVCVNDIRNSRFVMWVMEEKSWTKKCDIYWSKETLPYAPSKPCGPPGGRRKEYAPLMHPFYVYETGEILFRVFRGGMNAQVLLYKRGEDEENPWRVISREISHIAFVCAQGIFSPASQLVNVNNT